MFVYIETGVGNVLGQVQAEIMSSRDCRALDSAYMSSLTDNMFCVRHKEASEDFCRMMGGSSLVCRHGDRWWQYGLVSWGLIGCPSPAQPTVHSDVSKYLSWIEQNIRS